MSKACEGLVNITATVTLQMQHTSPQDGFPFFGGWESLLGQDHSTDRTSQVLFWLGEGLPHTAPADTQPTALPLGEGRDTVQQVFLVDEEMEAQKGSTGAKAN